MNIYYSGIEGKIHYNACVEAGCKHVLISYLYLDKLDPNLIKKRKKNNPEIKFMIDSGAHSFQSDKEKYDNWSLQDFEEYIARYVAWIRKNRDYIESCVELDIDWNVGTSVVENWQKRYFIPLMKEGINVIFVWHKQRGIDAFEEMCSRFPYVGLPGEFSSEPDFNKYVTIAKRYTTKLHGFAATKQTDLRDWPWYSGDSTSWKSAERYGVLIHWDEHGQKLIQDQDKSKRGNYRSYFLKHRLDADGIIDDTNYKEVTKYALISFRSMEEFYERKYKDRTFYYQLRLPHPNVVGNFSENAVLRYRRLLQFDTVFKFHGESDESLPVGGKSYKVFRRYLAAISAVQWKDLEYLEQNKSSVDFLQPYFPKLFGDQIADLQIAQKEMSMLISPRNPPPLERVEPAHYVENSNAPKSREEKEYSFEDLDVSDELPAMFNDL